MSASESGGKEKREVTMLASDEIDLSHHRTEAFYFTLCPFVLVSVWLRVHGCGIRPHVMSVHRLPKIEVLRLRKGKSLERNNHTDILVYKSLNRNKYC